MTDYTSTQNPTSLNRAEAFRPFPAWVKEEPIGEGLEKKASAAFADTERRLLPIHDKRHAFLSAIDLFANYDSYSPDVCERVKEAAESFEILGELSPYATHAAELVEKSASETVEEPRTFAIDTMIGDTPYRLFPVDSANGVRQAASEVTKMAGEGRIHYLHFVDAAQTIVKAAAEHGVPTSEFSDAIRHAGIERECDLEKAAGILETRAEITGNDEHARASYCELARQARQGADPGELMGKIASVDAAVGMPYRFTGRGMQMMPHAIVFSGPPTSLIKAAAETEVVFGDTTMPIAAFRSIPHDELLARVSRDAGEIILEAVKSGAQALTLEFEKMASADAKEMIRMAVEHG